jgi:hypothetical protein
MHYMKNETLRKSLLATLYPLNILMLVYFWAKTGMKSYIIISAVVTLGWISFILVVLKCGYMLGRRVIIAKEQSPMKFYGNVLLLLLGYLLMILFSVGLYLQETGYLVRN